MSHSALPPLRYSASVKIIAEDDFGPLAGEKVFRWLTRQLNLPAFRML